MLQALYERAIAEADRRRWNGEANAEVALRSFWAGYLDVLVSVMASILLCSGADWNEQRLQEIEVEAQATTFQRALKSVPASGEVWARYMRFLVRAHSTRYPLSAE